MEELTPSNRRRPALLTILCIFSFFFSGAMTLFSLAGIVFSGVLTSLIRESVPGLEDLSAVYFIVSFLVLLILFGLSLWGAILMFGLRKGGFVLYVIPNGIKLVALVIYMLGAFNYYILALVITSTLMIVLYAGLVKFMKKLV
jgi:hypothetical protein